MGWKRLIRPSREVVGVKYSPLPLQNQPLPRELGGRRDLGDAPQAPMWESLVEVSAGLGTKYSQGLGEVSNVLSTTQAWSWSSMRRIFGSKENE